MKHKRLLALMLSIFMLITLTPNTILAENDTTSVVVQSVTASAGTIVDVPVIIHNNPGILGATLKITYDSKLTLQNITNGSAFSALTMTKPGAFTSPCNVTWDGQDIDEEDIVDGNILVLRFAIPNNANEGETFNISASYEEGDFVDSNLNPVELTITNGAITIVNIKYGDLDGDDKVNSTDVIMMRRHIAGGYSQTINELAADVNLDTNINTTDVILVRRFIAGGYGVDLPYRVCKHNLEAISAKEATETEEGNIAYWRCKSCGKLFSDAAGTTVIALADTIIPIIEKDEYSIQYACDMVPQAADTYRPSEGKVLPKPTLDKYTFVGWSDSEGNIWDNIPVGTKGNITLYANWASNRNKAEAVKSLGEPVICEDSENGLILFSYEIGTIKNVPLYTTLQLQCANGIISTVKLEEQDTISETNAKTVAEKVSTATTNSTSWTLSSDWNNTTEVSESYLEQEGKTREEAESEARSSTGTYSIASSSGGRNSTTDTNSGSYKLSINNGHLITNTEEAATELTTGSKTSSEISGGFALDFASIGGKIGTETNKENKDSYKTTISGTSTWAVNLDNSEETCHSSVDESTWNSSSSYSSSNTVSKNRSVSNTISSLVSKQYGYGSSYSEGGSNSQAQALASTDSNEQECSSAVTYFNSKITTKTTTFSSTGNTHGNYRMVMAGTVHVFAVVCYDIAKQEYCVYTYNVLGDGSKGNDAPSEYLDYSWDGSFDDYETSIIPFEVPYFVNQYVNCRIATSDLQIDVDTGIVENYTKNPNEPDTVIIIPSYVRVDNHDGTYSAIKITGIRPNLFKDDTDIVGVSLSSFIDEIPESTFEGCSSLREVVCPNATRIGNNAFKGCTSLSAFTLPEDTESVGLDAFKGVPQVKALTSSTEVAQEVASCGADNIVLDISNIPEDESQGMEFNIGEISTFELRGKDKEYKGLSVKSDAEATIINGVNFTENTKIPMEFSSENVTLDRVTVDCVGLALALKADCTDLVLNRNVNLISQNENTVLCKSVFISNLSSSVVGKLNVTGNILACEEIDGENYITFSDGEIVYINEDEFDNYLSAHRVSFDANGGTVTAEDKLIPLASAFGELPVPTRDYYTFDGWYTAATGGTKITADSVMTSLTDITLYAHWTLNSVSAWTLASNVPAGAEIVGRKYTYTLTSYTSSSSSSLSGWNQYDNTWVWSSYGSWSGWQDSWVGGSDSRDVQTKDVPASYYMSSYYWKGNWYSYYPGGGGNHSKTIDASIVDSAPTMGEGSWLNAGGLGTANGYINGGTAYIIDAYNEGWTQAYFKQSTNYKTQYRYRDRSKIYTYYFKKVQNNKESTSYPSYKLLSTVSESNHPSGDYMSNVQEYVQYRTK